MLRPFKNEPLTDFNIDENRIRMEEALTKVESQLGKEYPIIIDGEELFLNDKFSSRNPADVNQIIGTFQKAGVEEGKKAVEVAYKNFDKWSNLPYEERAMILIRAASILRHRKFEFAAWQVFEVGKNWAEADGDVAEAIDYLEFYAREMLRYGKGGSLTPMEGEYNELIYLPIGPVAVIPPWNFPLAILLGMTTAALVSGNTVVLKPASDAPAIGFGFYKLMEEAGLPKGVLQYVTGPGSTCGDAIVSHPKTRMIAFTGSKEIGLRINEIASKVQPGQIWIKRVIAEMGGKDLIIVDNEYPQIEDAVKAVLASAFGYQGQKCSAGSRAIVVEDVYDKFVSILSEKVKGIEVGMPKDNYFMGPVINESSKNKILQYIEIGKQESKLLYGGEEIKGTGFFIQPTIFVDVPPEARIAQEEIFGPVLAVIKAKDFDDALRIANSTIYGLTGSVFTLNREKISKAKKELYVGNMYINRKCTGALVDVHPFGGFNMSGTDSKAGGRDYLLLFMQAKSISEKYV